MKFNFETPGFFKKSPEKEGKKEEIDVMNDILTNIPGARRLDLKKGIDAQIEVDKMIADSKKAGSVE